MAIRYSFFAKESQNLTIFSDLLKRLLVFSTLFFMFGLIVDTTLYFFVDNEYLLGYLNVLSIIIIGLSYVAFRKQKMNANNTMLAQTLTIATNIIFSIIYMSYNPNGGTELSIIISMMAVMLSILLTGMTKLKFVPFIIGLVTTFAFIFAAVKLDSRTMYECIPMIILIMIGASIAIWRLFATTVQIEKDNLRISSEQNNLLSLLELNEKQLELIKSKQISHEDALKLLNSMDERMQERVMSQAKRLVQNESQIIESTTSLHPGLTSSELAICCLIVEGRSVNEICKIRNVSSSTVTSTRSRLRTKLGLKSGDNLQAYLNYITRSALR